MRRIVRPLVFAACISMCAVGVAGCGSGGGGNATTEASDVGPQGSDTKTEDATELDAATGLSLESVQPAQGPASGGTEVLLAGRGFESGATVEFGGKSASEVEFVSSTEIAATTPPADAQGPVDVRVESGGESDTLEDGFTYREDEKPASIGWCKLQHPPLIDTKVGKKAGPIAGRVYVEDCTKGSQKCEKVTAQVGVGPSDGDPTASPGDFDWTDASYNADHTSDNNDEYLASVRPKKKGTFAYVYRFSLEGKDEWTYCDLNDSSDGFQTEQMGEMTVDPKEQPPSVDWCNIQHPPSATVEAGSKTPTIYGRVFSKNCTESKERCKALTAELGWGDPSVDPSKKPGTFDWKTASFNADHKSGDNNDEYGAKLKTAKPGSFAYAYRFSADGGNSWTYCDVNGTDKGGFSTDQMGELIVEKKQKPVSIGWCKLQHPPSIDVKAGDKTPTVYGRVFAKNCTEDKPNSRVKCDRVKGQVGWGPKKVDPSAKPGKYDWADATYNSKFPPSGTKNNNDEHMASFKPQSAGTFDYVYRFSGDGGGSWTYCDLDGASFEPNKEGTLTVK